MRFDAFQTGAGHREQRIFVWGISPLWWSPSALHSVFLFFLVSALLLVPKSAHGEFPAAQANSIVQPRNADPPPELASGGVVNTADYSAAIAPGAMISLFGTNLAPATRKAETIPLPDSLAGVTVEVTLSGKTANAPLYFVSSGQINAQLPFDVANAEITVRVRNPSGLSGPATVTVRKRAPRLFTWTQDGKGDAIIVHALDYGLVTKDRPAQSAEFLVLYLTGLGTVAPASTAGQPGGDGGAAGPVQSVTGAVQVTIGGRPATVHFAGLAPGFAGLYQVNLQAPLGLGAGAHAIEVVCEAEASQRGVQLYLGAPAGSKPEAIVQAALEAQARGDVAAMMSYFALDEYSEAAQKAGETVLETVRRMVTFSGFRFTHLATAPGDRGTLAVVRGLVQFTATTAEGQHSLNRGVLAFLKKKEGEWKILSVNPDELLNQEIYERDGFAKSAGKPLSSNLLDISALNKAITDALNSGYVNEYQLVPDTAFAIIGKAPGWGDSLANVYQVASVIDNAQSAVRDLLKNGFTAITALKLKQAAVGILQIASEPVPGLDTMADEVQAALGQLTYNLEIARALNEVRIALQNLPYGTVKVNPRFYQGPAILFSNLPGVEVEPDPGDFIRYSYGVPVGRLRLTAPTVLGKTVSLQVVGEVAFEANLPLASALIKTGAQLRDGFLYLPVDVTYLAAGEESKTTLILDGYDKYQSPGMAPAVLRWDATCRRGMEQLIVRLQNGERTPPLMVVNEYMNAVNSLELLGASATGITLASGHPLSGIRVIGRSFDLDSRFWPDLTPYGQCLAMAVEDPAIAEIQRGDTVTLVGMNLGRTKWRLLLGGSADVMQLPDVSLEVPLEVTLPRTPQVGYVRAQFDGLHSYTGGGPPEKTIAMTNEIGMELKWEENHFFLDGKITIQGDRTIEVKVDGQIDPKTLNLLAFAMSRIDTVPLSSRRETVFRTTGVIPIASLATGDAGWMLGGQGLRQILKATDVFFTWSGTTWQWIGEYTGTDWSPQVWAQTFHVLLHDRPEYLSIEPKSRIP